MGMIFRMWQGSIGIALIIVAGFFAITLQCGGFKTIGNPALYITQLPGVLRTYQNAHK